MKIQFYQTSDPIVYRQLMGFTRITTEAFCEHNGFISVFDYSIRRGSYPWQATFNRILYLKDLFDKGYNGWLCYMDADSYIHGHSFDLENYLGQYSDKLMIGVGRSHWQINAGVFCLNFAHHVAPEFIELLNKQFENIVSDEFLAASPNKFDERWYDYFGDQTLMQNILKFSYDYNDIVHLDDGSTLNSYNAFFIRQALRRSGNLESRVNKVFKDSFESLNSSNYINKERYLAKMLILHGHTFGADESTIHRVANENGFDVNIHDGIIEIISFYDNTLNNIYYKNVIEDEIMEINRNDSFSADVCLSRCPDDKKKEVIDVFLKNISIPSSINLDDASSFAALAEKEIQCFPDIASGYYKASRIYLKAGDLIKAELRAKESLDRFFSDEILCLIAAIQEKLNKNTESITNGLRAIDVNPLNMHAYLIVAKCYSKMNDYEKAKNILIDALKFDRSNAAVYRAMSGFEYQDNNLLKSQEYINHAIEIQPDNSDFHGHHANILMKMNKPRDAARSYENCIMYGTKNFDFYSRAAHLYASIGNNDRALEIAYLAAKNLNSEKAKLLPNVLLSYINHINNNQK